MIDIMKSTPSPKVIVAVLNWGIGHASRCVPLINELQRSGKEVVVFSDGIALEFLLLQFPSIEFCLVPSYNIRYAGKVLLLEMFFQLPRIAWAAHKERRVLSKWLRNNACEGIFSDNRLGFVSTKVPSYYITHQLNIPVGFLSPMASFFHFLYYRKFKAVLVPDQEGEGSLSGVLSKPFSRRSKIYKLGLWSRFEGKSNVNQQKKEHILILLSGPEPARTEWELELLSQISEQKDKRFVLVRGSSKEREAFQLENLVIYDLLGSEMLEDLIERSIGVVCRSGYSTLMDLALLQAKAFVVATPGQTEQLYLAEYHSSRNHVRTASQKNFSLEEAVREIEEGIFGFENPQEANFKELLARLP